ncbi:MAG TPA: DUF885 domain-containing protein [Acidimicrobiia bacterium]|nr:DUF885 domain-containing protein [Acidimicrobiia bacterium]
MPTPFEISDRFTEAWADVMPIAATTFGITGRDHLCTDWSPEAYAGRADLYRRTKTELEPHLEDPDRVQSFAAQVMVGWLEERIADHEAGKWRRDLNHTESPFQEMRDVFDVMPRETAEQWEAIAARLEGFEGMLEGYRKCLQAGMDETDTVAVRQVESVLEQVEAAASDKSRFVPFPAAAAQVDADSDSVARAVDGARAACARFGQWLAREYLPAARLEDAVGREAYLHGADEFLGMTIDCEETYAWGWDEVGRIRAEMASTAAEIASGSTVEDVIELLETDPERSAATRDDFVAFVSGIQQHAIDQLSGGHFDVPEELRTVTVNIAPPGGSLGAWYVSPAEDFSRPGSIWYAPGERDRLPYWQEVSTAYHEGFPGHHLQVGTAVLQRDKLSRFHRSVIWYSGAGEGWALYAERLMDELGFFEKPEYRFGLLASQLFRSVRVVVDIGCQLGLTIPQNAPLYQGDVWDYERAVEYLNRVAFQPLDVAESEVKRYLGWWGQAISYKVGEREILAMRDRARSGADYDQRAFHRRLLDAGAIRLDHLWEVMA